MEKKFVTENIYYVDNILPKNLIDHLHDKLHKTPWVIHKTDFTLDIEAFFWASNLFDERFQCENEEIYKEEILFLKNLFNDRKILRIYVNGQTSNQHGEFHKDDGEITYLIGLSKDWNMQSGGATEFVLDSDNCTTISVYPKYNRLIAFPAHIEHRALVNFNINDFRMTLAIKTDSLSNENEEQNNEKYKINFL